jgi:small basic protein
MNKWDRLLFVVGFVFCPINIIISIILNQVGGVLGNLAIFFLLFRLKNEINKVKELKEGVEK